MEEQHNLSACIDFHVDTNLSSVIKIKNNKIINKNCVSLTFSLVFLFFFCDFVFIFFLCVYTR